MLVATPARGAKMRTGCRTLSAGKSTSLKKIGEDTSATAKGAAAWSGFQGRTLRYPATRNLKTKTPKSMGESNTTQPNSTTPRSSGSASCSASFDLDAPRLRELLEDYVRDKRQIGKDLGLPENERLHHRSQRRIIFDLQRENRMMRMALKKVYERMQGPASNRRLMQIAGPARECINLAKPFLPNTQDHQP